MGFESEVNGRIDEVIINYEDAMLQAGDIAWNKIEPQILKLRTDGTKWARIVAGQPINVGTPLVGAIQSSRVIRAKEQMKNSLDSIRLIIRDFYEERFNEETPYEIRRLATGEVEGTKNIIDNQLGEVNFIANVVFDAEGAMSKHLNDGSTIDATLEDMNHRIADRLDNFSFIRSSTILQTYARKISEIYGNRPHRKAKYVGPNDELNRPFCRERVGGVYSQAEVKSWATLGDWDGKMPDTNMSNIETNLGGYNCRHILEWIET